jgi:uncharacterized membrane protein (UPF0127 family)
MPKKKQTIIGVLVLFFIVPATYIYLTNSKTTRKIFSGNEQSQITHDVIINISGNEINAQVAQTPTEKARGLSGKTHLAQNEGMIFTFQNKTRPSFWMKDMNFALDIIWILDNKIVHIDKDVQPPNPDQKETSLPLYTPPKAINYVLEVNAGYAQKHGIKVGDSVDFSNLE